MSIFAVQVEDARWPILEAFDTACGRGDLDGAKAIHRGHVMRRGEVIRADDRILRTQDSPNAKGFNDGIDFHASALKISIRRGYLDVARWLIKEFDITPAEIGSIWQLLVEVVIGRYSDEPEGPYTVSEVIEWLVDECKLEDLHGGAHSALTWACSEGNLPVSELLRKKFNLGSISDRVFEE